MSERNITYRVTRIGFIANSSFRKKRQKRGQCSFTFKVLKDKGTIDPSFYTQYNIL